MKNKNIDIISDRIYSEVLNKRELFKETITYRNIVNSVAELKEVSEMEDILSNNKKLLLEKKAIEEEIRLNTLRFRDIAFDGEFGEVGQLTLNKYIENSINARLDFIFPSKEEIKSDVVIKFVTGSKKKIKAFLKKYDLI